MRTLLLLLLPLPLLALLPVATVSGEEHSVAVVGDPVAAELLPGQARVVEHGDARADVRMDRVRAHARVADLVLA